ncbi:ATP-grasp domain-containing protein [Cellulomonas iranensis]|uniref:Biotin carboxylase n=1 Tax=Cellulomonas iranensis TaxID=76862 RepID=A0ABU0GJB5_9CELL|nr:hypothetical protein [Cellulomonas iranensis]MDQ0424642.1 biotin carboxylase [Cellulomonas iranensis]
MTSTVLMVGCGVMGEPYLRAAARRGLRVALVETAARAATLAREHACVVATEEVPDGVAASDVAWVRPALALAERMRPVAVLPFAEHQVVAAAAVQRVLGLPGTGLDAALVSRDKSLQRALLRSADVGHPRSVVAAPLASFTDLDEIGLPVVVKALSSSGSDGVELVRDAAGWRDVVARRGAEPVLLEQYVTAQEYSWEAVVQHGQVRVDNVTRKTTTGPPEFVELAHEVAFGRRDPVLAAAARDLGAAVVRGMGMQDGIVSVEFRYDDGHDVPVLMEAMVRMPGDHIVDAICVAAGFDWFDAVLGVLLGEELVVPADAVARESAVVYAVAPQEGVLQGTGFDAVAALPGVRSARQRIPDGAQVRPPRSSADRLGAVLLDCGDHAALLAALDRTRGLLREAVLVTP